MLAPGATIARGEVVVRFGIGTREIVVVFGLALLGVLMAALAALAPWYGRTGVPLGPVVQIVAPESVAAAP
jgi:hypothetical protein